MDVKILSLFLYTTEVGWLYMTDHEGLQPGDSFTDGTDTFTVTDKREGFKYPYIREGSWLTSNPNTWAWVYSFDKKIPECEGKILKKLPKDHFGILVPEGCKVEFKNCDKKL